MRRRKSYEANFRAKVALEAIKGSLTLAEIAKEYKVHPNMIVKWKKEALEKFPTLFIKTDSGELAEAKEEIEELYKEIGKMKMETDYLKKKLMS
jgi:transposase